MHLKTDMLTGGLVTLVGLDWMLERKSLVLPLHPDWDARVSPTCPSLLCDYSGEGWVDLSSLIFP